MCNFHVDYEPEIGGECLALRDVVQSYVKVEILCKRYNGVYDVYACREIEEGSEVGKLFWSGDFKPLPPEYTEEEKLVYQWYKQKFEGTDATIEECISGERDKNNTFSNALEMMKMGWHRNPSLDECWFESDTEEEIEAYYWCDRVDSVKPELPFVILK